MIEKLRAFMKEIKLYVSVIGLIVMAVVFSIHLYNDISKKEFHKIDDHFYDTFKQYADNEAMDQADD